MAHWADDQVLVALQRVPGARMDVPALQESTGLGASDLEECLTGLRTEGLVREELDGSIGFVPDGERSTVAAGTGVAQNLESIVSEFGEPGPEASLGDGLRGPPTGVGIGELARSLVESVQAGEPVRVTAEVTLEPGPDGSMAVIGVRRVLGIERIR